MGLNINFYDNDMKVYTSHIKEAFRDINTEVETNGEHIFSFKFPRVFQIVNEVTMTGIKNGLLELSDIDYERMYMNKDYDDSKCKSILHKTPYGCYIPEEDLIFICPESIKRLAEGSIDYLNYGNIDDVFTRYLRYNILHELTHSTFNRDEDTKLDLRLSEGLANWVPNAFSDEYGKTLMAYKAIRQDFRYNYFLMFRRWKRVKDFLKLMGKDNKSEAVELFKKTIRRYTQGVNWVGSEICIKIGGNTNCPVGFGSTEMHIGIGGRMEHLCNFKGYAMINELHLLDGFLHNDSILIVNKINQMPFYKNEYYKSKPNNIFKIEKKVLDINEIIKNDGVKAEDIPEIIEDSLKIVIDYRKGQSGLRPQIT